MNKKSSFNPNTIRFSWIDDFIAGFAYPSSLEALEFLHNQGITDIISLSKDPAPQQASQKLGLKVHHLPITDFSVPDNDTVDKFISIVERCMKEGRKVGVHCKYGIGRTGMMLALYLMEFKGLSASDAIVEIRKARPGSIEVREQEYFLLTHKPRRRG